MRLTDEQNDAVDLFCAGRNLKVTAFAGAGKTRTLEAMAEETTGPALYVAYNRAIAAEARMRFPQGTRCATVHALAYQALQARFGTRKMTGVLATPDLIEILGVRDRPFGGHELTARAQAGLVRTALERFLHGARAEPQGADVPLTGRLAAAPTDACVELIEVTAARVRLLWQQMIDPCNPVPLGHDGYLKLWALGHPRLDTDHVFLDEAQDTNAVVLDVLRRQDTQLVYVGDPHQRIYGWRGAIDVMAAVPAAHGAALTQSFRFGAAIAEAASRIIAGLGETRQLAGNPAVCSRIGPCAPDAVIARTNAGVVDAVLDALMIGERPYVVGGTGELMRLLVGVEQLKHRSGAAAPELIGFASWGDVVETAAAEREAGLRTLVTLVEEYGEERLIAALGKVARNEASADVVISTAHRAKGREWDRVQLRDDFARVAGLLDGGAGPFDQAEARLVYVALTRARLAVSAPPDLFAFYGCPGEDED